VGWVMAELPALGYVAKVGGRRRLVNGQRLLDQWTEAYARTLRPRLLLGRTRTMSHCTEARDRFRPCRPVRTPPDRPGSA
jgi:hypothetical protein